MVGREKSVETGARKGKSGGGGAHKHPSDMNCGIPCPACGRTDVYLKAMPPGHPGAAAQMGCRQCEQVDNSIIQALSLGSPRW